MSSSRAGDRSAPALVGVLDPRVRWVPREWDFLPTDDSRPLGPGVVREP
jgi:hypothetical protein